MKESTFEKASDYGMDYVEIEESKKYYWAPAMQWKREDKEVYIEDIVYSSVAAYVFPKLYFITQEGITIEDIFKEFPMVDGEQLNSLLKKLINNKVLVNSILPLKDVFNPLSKIYDNKYGDEIFYDVQAYDNYKKQQLNRVLPYDKSNSIKLKNEQEYPITISNRRTCREFNENKKISLSRFSKLMSVFKQVKTNNEIRYYYASAGGLYPIDIYVYVKENRVDGIVEGLYYYNPKDNSLALVNETEKITKYSYGYGNRSIFESSAFSIYFIYNADGTMPKYGSMGYIYACVDAGIMVSTLTQVSETQNVGLCSIGTMDFEGIRSIFKLNKNQIFVHAIEIGLKTGEENTQEENESKNIHSIKPVDKREYYPLASPQKRMYFLNTFQKESTNYNNLTVIELEGEIYRNKIEEIFEKIVDRHETFRAVFEIVDEEPMQKIYDKVDFKVEYSEVKEEREIEEKVKDFIRPFDLSKAPLLRVGLIKISENKHMLMVDMHHIISDGVSIAILMGEFARLYKGESLPEIKIQYKDYAMWQREGLESEEIKKQEKYWLETFSEDIPTLNMPIDYKRPTVQNFQGNSIDFDISKELTEKMYKLAKENQTTLYMVLLTGYNILLSKYTGGEDIVIGSPIAGRAHADLRNIVGMFVNILALRNYPEGDKTIKEFLKEVKENCLRAYDNQNYQYEELVEKLNILRDTSRNPLFDVVFVLQNMDIREVDLKDAKAILSSEYRQKISKFDLTLCATETSEEINLNIEYATSLFKEATIKRLGKRFIDILEKMVENPDSKIHEVNMLTDEEKQELLYDFNDTKAEYAKDKTVHQFFEQQVEMTPDNIALVFEDKQLTYREVNERANQVARVLREKGVKPNTIVGIMVEHSIEMIVGIIGVLKAGGAYLPIDSTYPKNRIMYLLEDSNTNILLTQEKLMKKIEFEGEIIDLEDKNLYKEESTNLEKINKPRDLAYVIYTSGSTGKPKGVMIEHQGAVNYIWWANKNYLYDSNEIFPLYSSISFDLTITSIFTPLISGNTVAIYHDDEDEFILYKVLKDNKATIAKLTPAHLTLIKDLNNEESSIKRLIVGGENLTSQLAKEVIDSFGGKVEIFNEYGPTETTVGCMIHKYNPEIDNINSVPIGKPADNVQIYILDKNLNPVVNNTLGELYISGDGLARGYLNKPEITKEKFVQHPFFEGERIYKTGDLARMLPGGNIEFIGRIDNQVKLRGYRIELGEIENAISNKFGVKEAIVLSRKDKTGMDYLCGYVVKEENILIEKIKEEIRKELPDYMIPSVFIELDKIPLTTNGKINRKALLEMEAIVTREEKYEGAGNETEARLIGLWEDVLGVDGIGVHDNFFDLGGHSLKATILSGRMQKELNVDINVSDIFLGQNIRGLAELIKESSAKEYEKLIPLKKQEFYPVSSAQRRVYAIQMMNKESTLYNMPLTLELTGKVNRDRIENAIEKLVSKHEALRTSFHLDGEEIVQKIEEEAKVELDYAKAEEKKEIDNILTSWIKPFNLEKAPLLRGGIIETKDSYMLMLDMHHIISDGTTMGILAEDFIRAYEGTQLDTQAIQYKEYAAWERIQKENGVWDKQREYWKKEYEGEIPVLELPMDGTRGSIEDNEGDTISFEIDENIIKSLKERMWGIGGTLYMGLMAAINILMSKYSSQEDIVIGMPIAGRRHPQMEKVVGMFVNTLAIRSYPEGEKTIEQYLEETKQKLLRAYENQEYPYEELVEEVGVKRDLSRNPLFDVMLVLQNTELREMKLSEIEIKPWRIENSTAKFDISLIATEAGNRLICGVNYKSRLFKRETIEGMIRHYIKVLKEISESKEELIKDIDLLEEVEKRQLISKLRHTNLEYDKNKTIVQLFENQLDKTEENIAVAYGEEKLTYNQLNIRANQLARVLRDKGVDRDSIVGIMLEPSLEMIVGILAILKSGGAYLPIDPYQPEDRIAYILKDSKTQIVVSAKELIHKISISAQIIDIDNRLFGVDGSNLKNINKPSDLAYIIYTSGSTGKPKGVMIEHTNVVSLMANNKYLFNFNNNDTWCMFHSYVFDFSIWEMLGALLHGGKLIVIPKYIAKDTKKFLDVIEKEEITVLNQTPSAFYNLINEEIKGVKRELKLRYVIFGGEALNPSKLKAWKERYPNTELINMYGITETTVHVTFKKLEESDFKSSLSNIGKAIPTLNTYIMDKNLKLLPIGVSGEIYVSGGGVARGYLSKSELTKEKFVINPYNCDERLYRSGDLGKLLKNGEIQYLGRIDNQVKIRGYRIELGEIENIIRKQEGVRDIIVLAREDECGDKYLCGYIVKEDKATIEAIRKGAKKELPEYMVPGVMVEIDKIPLTNNGKIDRKALLNMEVTILRAKQYRAPRNETEEKLVKIWEGILNNDKIGIYDDFFELGGHSLKATTLSGRIQKELDVEVTVRDIFECSNIRDLSVRIKESKTKEYKKLTPLKKHETYPSSSAQRRIYAIQMMDKESTVYNMPLTLELTGKVDREKIEHVIEKLVSKHETLRTSFHLEGEEIVQKIDEEVRVELGYARAEEKEEIDKIISGWIKPFNLERAPLLRGGIIETRDSYILMLDMHHIISDGTTMGILAEDFVRAYEGTQLDIQAIQYKEYAAWEKIQKEKGVWDKQKEYWKKEYEGEIPVLELPMDGARGSIEDNSGDTINFEIEENIIKSLKERMFDIGGTLYMGLMAGYSILMSKYSGEEDIVVGMPIAGRRHPQMEKVAGMFLNTLAIRSYPEGEKAIAQYLEETKQKLLRAYENQEYPYEELVEEVGIKRDLRRNPLFDVMLVLQNTELKEMKLSEIEIKPWVIENSTAKFDITLIATEVGDRLVCEVNYKNSLFERETIERMIKYYNKVLKELGERKIGLIKDIELLEEVEKGKLLYEFNNTKVEYPKEKTIQELFEEQVDRTPENIAVVYEGKHLTYSELNERANSLARELRDKGVKSDTIVGIMVERSLEMIVGIMAILKAGGSYLPIDIEYPKERIKYMLEDSSTKTILTHSKLMDRIDFDGEILDLEDEEIYKKDTINLSIASKPTDLAYVIYTSGSTGRPKGVMVEHRSLINYITWKIKKYEYGPEDVNLHLISVSFDAFGANFYPNILCGGKIVLIDKLKLGDPLYIRNTIKQYKVTNFSVLPSMYNLILENTSKEELETVTRVVTGGEKADEELIKRSFEINPNINFINEYGPTENSICTTSFEYAKDNFKNFIGKPIYNSKCYILDKNYELQPMGVPGELCISGDGLARGYLNRPKLTAEKFVENPFVKGEKIYKTGDLARWLPDGNIEFLGRIDDQVKIRGYRIELGEIENALLKHESIREAVVVAREDHHENKYLCGYIVADQEIHVSELRNYLKKDLPEYMIPSYLLQLDKMPITPNGKIDRKALPKPDGNINSGVEYEAPRNKIQEILVSIWGEVLFTNKEIGINDSFFEIGGDSIKAIQISARLQKYNLKLDVQKLFEYPTIKQISHYVKDSSKKGEQDAVEGNVKLTPIQKWFFKEKIMDMHHFNQSVMLYREEGFKVEIIETVFRQLIKHHDALRMVYSLNEEGIIQINRGIKDSLIDIEIHEIFEEEYEKVIEERAEKIQSSIDLGQGPLVKLGLFKTKKGDYLLIAIHHLVIDGVSWRIIFEDFTSSYKQVELGQAPQLPLKTTSFKQWAEGVSEYSKSTEFLKEIEYWRSIENENVLPLPKDNKAKENKLKDSVNISFELSKEETENLLKKVNRAYNTEINDILLSALGLTIKEWAGRHKVLINLEGHGREEILENVDITRTVGWFTAQYPVVINMEESEDISHIVKNTKETLRRIPNKGIGHGILKYITPKEYREEINFNLIPEISFNYLGQFDTDIDNDLFEVRNTTMGNTMSIEGERHYELNIVGMIAGGLLNITIDYNKHEYTKETILGLIEKFKLNLQRIIKHCVNRQEVERTPSDFTSSDLNNKILETVFSKYNEGEASDIYSLSPMQEGMLFHYIMDRKSSAYIEQSIIDIKGKLDLNLVENSFNKLIEKYDVLRTVFIYEGLEKPRQVLLKNREAQVEFKDISWLEEANKAKAIRSFEEKDREKGFDLEKDIPMRISIIKTHEESYKLIWSFYHIIMDGWCLAIIIRDFLDFYISLKNGDDIRVRPTTPYSAYIKWLEKRDKSEGLEYWSKYLEGYEEQVVIPKPKAARGNEYKVEEQRVEINRVLTEKLKTISKKYGVTINTIFEVVWGTLLSKYNNTEDVVFGTVVAGRSADIPDIENMVGLFINTIPVRIKYEKGDSLIDLARKVQEKDNKSRKYDYIPLAEIQSGSELKQELINHLLVFENYPIAEKLAREDNKNQLGFSIDDIKFFEHTNYDFAIVVDPGDSLNISFKYNASIYDDESINRIGMHLLNIVENLIEDEEIRICDIEILTEKEKEEILYSFNDTAAEYHKDKTIVELFEEKVERIPDSIAVVYEDQKLTYRQLNERANSLARLLREKGVKAESIVAIMVERSLEMLVGILGILKAGGAYLPIDPNYPRERIEYLIEDSQSKILLVQDKTKGNFDGVKLLNLESDNINDYEKSNLNKINTSSDLAYVIYTSGSTGNPKGVMIEHKSLVNRLNWMQKQYKLGSEDVILQKTTYTFDVSVWELFWWGIYGASLYLLGPNHEKEPEKILEAIEKHNITIMHFVPSMLSGFLKYIEETDIKNVKMKLRQVFTSGEALQVSQVKDFYKYFYDVRLSNLYGPTEATIDVTYYDCENGEYNKSIPIGKAIDNTQIYIIDKNKKLAPIGVAGELCIAGDGLARGYLNREELTKEKFVDNSFESGQKMYKTGDLASWLPDGNIEFLGRIDHQVKIRGYRIELGEIENELLKHEKIEEAVVIDGRDKSGSNYLCGYVVTHKNLSIAQIREYLGSKLPQYMIPAYFMKIDEMPLTSNGKIDRKSLPKLDESIVSEAEHEEARNEKEEKLIEVWEDVLARRGIGINDNFFEIGGDSIKAIQISARLQRHNLKLEIQKIFEHPTIKQISYYVKDISKKGEQGLVQGDVKLTPIQKWFFEEKITNMHHFNQSVTLYREEGFKVEIIETAFRQLIKHHDALRMVYSVNEEEITQINRGIKDSLIDIEIHEIFEEEYEKVIEERAEKIQSSIDLGQGPLVKLGLFKTKKGDYLLIAIHHLVIDGVSWRIIFEDFTSAYKQIELGQAPQLPLKTTSFKQWAEGISEYSKSKELLKEIEYWRSIENENILPLPKDNKAKENKLKDSVNISFELSKEETENLLKKVNRAYNTEINDILLSALGLTIKEWAGRHKVLINLEGHGREEILENVDITRTVGWFTAQYPVVINIEESEDTSHIVKNTKETLRRIPNKGIGHGILKYITPKECKQQINFNLMPEISFNYLGQFDTDIDNDLFEVRNTAMGNTVSIKGERHYVLNIVGIIAGGLLNITIDYNKHEYTKETILILLEKFKSNLQKIIKHCVNREEVERTPSDFTSSDLNNKILKTVFSKYNEGTVSDIYSLSPMQEGMLFHYIMDKNTSAYFEQTVIDVNGKVNLNLVENSFNKLIEKYDILRTVFIYTESEKPRQVLFETRREQVEFKDISWLEEANKTEAIKLFEEKDREKGFNLEKDISMRISIIKTHEERYKLIWSFHHIIMDGWCLAIIIRDFLDFYISLKNGYDIRIRPTTPYSAYIKWLEKRDKSDGIKYWREYLKDYEEKAVIPKTKDYRGNEYKLEEQRIEINGELTNKLSTIVKKYGVTINTIFEVIWGTLLSRYNNTDDVVFGSVVAGRSADIPDIENMVGLFINTIPVRVKYEEGDSFIDLARKVQQKDNKSRKYDYMPLAEIQSNSELRQQLINHTMVFENYPVAEKVMNSDKSNELDFTIENFKIFEQTNYNFMVSVLPGDKVNVEFQYNSMIYDKEIIKGIANHLINVVKQVVNDEEIKINEIKTLIKEEEYMLLNSFNDTKAEYPKDKTVKELFEEQVERTPEDIAVVYKDKALTYRELNEISNSLARELRSRGVKADTIVGIMLERSIEMVVGIIGILKAGGAYLPIDSQYPEERIKYIIEDSNLKLLITRSSFLKNQFSDLNVIDIDDNNIFSRDKSNLTNINKSSDLLYVIYTSGSTGKPKGVMIEHNSFVNITYGWKKEYGLEKSKVNILQMANFAFDVFSGDISRTLLNGGKLVVCPNEIKTDPESLYKLIKENKISIFESTPALIVPFMDYIYDKNLQINSLKLLIIGSDKCSVKDFKRINSRFGHKMRIINSYGVTEATIDSSFFEQSNEEIIETVNTPIGKPMQNIKFYVLDKNLKIQPRGVYGELFIGGAGVARGYLNKPKLTQDRFIENPYIKGERIYKTGDLARWLPDGNIEFLGRNDQQVKIRGYRIELGEIENVLGKHPDLKESAIVTKEDLYGNKYLAAYVSPKADKDPDKNEIYDYIKTKLPDYMVPSWIMVMPKLPLTPNGKIDRLNLSKSDNYINRDKQFTAPRNQIELEMVEIWQSVLGIEEISIFDNFFTLGGHSIIAMVLIDKIRSHFNIELPLAQIFESPTVAQISDKVRENEKNSNNCLVTIQKGDSSKPPLFIVHAHGGGVFSYFDLAKALGTERTVYGIQAVGLDSDEAPLTSIEAMATRYIEEIKGVAPMGPYCIAGWCFGGIVTFEIARQLEELGEKIEFIGIIDAQSPELEKEDDILEGLPLFVKFAKLIGMDINQFNRLEEEKILELVIIRGKEIDLFPHDATKVRIVRKIKVILNNSDTIISYKPNNNISSDINLFYATEKTKNNNESLIDTRAWEKNTSGQIELIPIEGNHYTIMEPPNVTSLAEAINIYLNGNVTCEEAFDIC